MKLNVVPLMDAIDAYIRKADEDLEEQLESEGFICATEAVAAISAIEDAVASALGSNMDDLLERIQTATGVEEFIADIWPGIKNADDLKKALHDIFQKQFDDLMHQFTFNWIVSEDPELAAVIDDRITKPAEEFIIGWSDELAGLMQLSTKDQIEKILLTAQEKSQTIEEVAEAIANSGIRECGYRSRRVAVTEVLRVQSYAHQEARIQNPSCYAKRWIHTGEAKTPRENHRAMHGQEVFKREPFILTGRDGSTYYPICPRDTSLPASESVNCHCRTEDVIDKKVFGMTVDERKALREKYMDEVDAEYEAAHATDTVDMIKSMEREDQIRYFGGKNGGKQRMALIDSGVISTDKELEKLYKTDENGKKSRKTLQELADSGIFTVSDNAVKHSSIGEFSGVKNPNKPVGGKNGGNMKGGGHSQANMDELTNRGIAYKVEKTYDNGVRIGGVANHTSRQKQIGGTGQSWFPSDWDNDKIMAAGTYTVNKPSITQELHDKDGNVTSRWAFAKYDGVTVGVIMDNNNEIKTVFPDELQRKV